VAADRLTRFCHAAAGEGPHATFALHPGPVSASSDQPAAGGGARPQPRGYASPGPCGSGLAPRGGLPPL
jgi:hypothetical protein